MEASHTATPPPILESNRNPTQPSAADHDPSVPTRSVPEYLNFRPEDLPSPVPEAAHSSAKLSALHARLALSSRLPLETLARTLVHPTADSSPQFNNQSLAILGGDLTSYYMAEYIMAKYPRIPMVVFYAAQAAYVGDKSLNTVASEWGVEIAGEPGGEVDPGLLQFKRAPIGTPTDAIVDPSRPYKNRRGEVKSDWRRGMPSRNIYDDEFGDVKNVELPDGQRLPIATLEQASASFVRALFGAIYVHAGSAATYDFFKSHFLSRHLDLSALFTFKQPTRDLSRLCAREGFESPVARMESETGRMSRHPVFVVGVYSGRDKLGEGAGASLDEARFRASVAALKGWYLYSPHGEPVVPSQAGTEASKPFRPLMVDFGEVNS